MKQLFTLALTAVIMAACTNQPTVMKNEAIEKIYQYISYSKLLSYNYTKNRLSEL